MPTLQYPKNPNVDTAFVTDDNNKRNRALKTVLVDGTIDYPSNSNSTGCYVTIDGKKQRAMMTADISSAGTLEYPENSNSTKGYVDINGKKQRVVLTAAIAGGGTPINNQDKYLNLFQEKFLEYQIYSYSSEHVAQLTQIPMMISMR